MDMSAFLPVWIIGAPLVFAIVERFMTPGVARSDGRLASPQPGRTGPSSAAARNL